MNAFFLCRATIGEEFNQDHLLYLAAFLSYYAYIVYKTKSPFLDSKQKEKVIIKNLNAEDSSFEKLPYHNTALSVSYAVFKSNHALGVISAVISSMAIYLFVDQYINELQHFVDNHTQDTIKIATEKQKKFAGSSVLKYLALVDPQVSVLLRAATNRSLLDHIKDKIKQAKDEDNKEKNNPLRMIQAQDKKEKEKKVIAAAA